MADKASRGLVLYGDGLVQHIGPHHTHIHSLASLGTCGFLSLTNPPHAESEDERVIRELALLLDSYDSCITKNEEHFATLKDMKPSVPTISERFMGMRAAIFTTNSSVKSFGRYLGLTVLQIDELIKCSNSLSESPASELMKLLGFQGGKTLETGEFDLVFVHIGLVEKANDLKGKIAGNDVEWINALVGGILQIAQPGSEIGSRLHFSLVMSYGPLSGDEDPSLSNLVSQTETNSNLSLLFPHQSYTMKGGNVVNNIRHHCPMLITQWQEAVTRRDMAETFSFKEFKEHGANLAIPAERFLHEVAFKLWKAPKYGA